MHRDCNWSGNAKTINGQCCVPCGLLLGHFSSNGLFSSFLSINTLIFVDPKEPRWQYVHVPHTFPPFTLSTVKSAPSGQSWILYQPNHMQNSVNTHEDCHEWTMSLCQFISNYDGWGWQGSTRNYVKPHTVEYENCNYGSLKQEHTSWSIAPNFCLQQRQWAAMAKDWTKDFVDTVGTVHRDEYRDKAKGLALESKGATIRSSKTTKRFGTNGTRKHAKPQNFVGQCCSLLHSQNTSW